MRVERIKASTMREALNKIKDKLGEDAVVLHTRNVKDGIEVIAAQDADQPPKDNTWLDEVVQRDKELRAESNSKGLKNTESNQFDHSELSYNRTGKNNQENQVKENEKKSSVSDNYSKWDKLMDDIKNRPLHQNLSHMTIEQLELATQKATEFSELLRDEIKTGQEQRRLWVEHEKQLDSLKQELVDLKESLLRQELMELKQRAKSLHKQKNEKNIKITSVKTKKSFDQFFDRVKTRLMEKGFLEGTAQKIVSRIKIGADSLGLEFTNKSHIQMLKNILTNEIKKLIPVYQLQNEPGKQKVMSLFGPRNSGKTLTSTKLVLQASIINNKKVALVLMNDSANSTRQYLHKLTKAANIPLTIISNIDEVKKIRQVHSDKDFIVFDYAIDVNSINHVNKLINYFTISRSIENHLVIPANISQAQIKNIKQNINKIAYKSIILTKMDELEQIGRIIDIVHQFGKPLSYICNGQTIPDDIEIANAAKLTHMILKG